MTGIKLLLITVICFVHKPNAENKTCLYELRTVMENIKKNIIIQDHVRSVKLNQSINDRLLAFGDAKILRNS